MSGWNTQFFYAIENNEWGTPQSSVATLNNKVPVISETIIAARKVDAVESYDGTTLLTSDRRFEGEISIEARYFDIKMLACALGYSHSNSPTNPDVNAYYHWFEADDDMGTRFQSGYDRSTKLSGSKLRRRGTFLRDDGDVWQLDGMMFDGFTLEARPERVTYLFNAVARMLEFNAVENPNSVTVGSGMPSGNKLKFSDMEIWLKPRDVFTLSGGTAKNIYIDEGAGAVSITLANGVRTGFQFAKYIENQLNATLSNTYVVEYQDHDRRFIFKANGAFIIKGTGNQNERLGFTSSDTTNSYYHRSPFDALPDDYSALTDADKIKVGGLTLSLQNNLVKESTRDQSHTICEPYRHSRRITGSLDFPRYENSNHIEAAIGGTIYLMKIRFTGESLGLGTVEQLDIDLPEVIVSPAEASVTGPQIIPERLAVEAAYPINFLDMINFTNTQYQIRLMPQILQGYIPKAVAIMNGDLHVAIYNSIQNLTRIAYIDSNSTVWSAFQGQSYESFCMEKYGDALYVGCSDGKVLKWTGAWSESTDQGLNDIVDLAVYNEKLYAVDGGNGNVYEFDGSTWSTSYTPGEGLAGYELQVYDGYLYVSYQDIFSGKVARFDGTNWVIVYDFGVGVTDYMCFAVNRNKLYAAKDMQLRVYDGTSWRVLTDPTISIQRMVSYRGNLLLCEATGEGNLYLWNLRNQNETSLGNNGGYAFMGKPKVFSDRLFIPANHDQPIYYGATKDILIRVQNNIANNPLL